MEIRINNEDSKSQKAWLNLDMPWKKETKPSSFMGATRKVNDNITGSKRLPYRKRKIHMDKN